MLIQNILHWFTFYESSLKREANGKQHSCCSSPLNLYLELARGKLSHFGCDHTSDAQVGQTASHQSTGESQILQIKQETVDRFFK